MRSKPTMPVAENFERSQRPKRQVDFENQTAKEQTMLTGTFDNRPSARMSMAMPSQEKSNSWRSYCGETEDPDSTRQC